MAKVATTVRLLVEVDDSDAARILRDGVSDAEVAQHIAAGKDFRVSSNQCLLDDQDTDSQDDFISQP